MSMHSYFGWRSQYDRLLRWHIKLQDLRIKEHSLDEELDCFLAFFQTCYHLRDWLENDSVCNSDELWDLINNHNELMLCQDLCNGSKHLKLHRAKVDKDFSIVRQYNPFSSEEGAYRSDELIILANGHQFTLGRLAERCVQIWKDFLQTKNLI